ncbi:MAG: hypothetical protein HOD27_04395, partial [Betaproteobacteria bacterium]|nr:hypothetical protein [Betaproteobacteria bacterium]
YQRTLTVWKSKEHMLGYLTSPPHLKAMENLSKIGEGKVYGYEASHIPSWEDAFTEWDKNGRIY